jgi:hypothetical protein
MVRSSKSFVPFESWMRTLALLIAALLVVSPAFAEEAAGNRVVVATPAPDATSATHGDKVRGEETLTVLFDALAGQDLAVSVESNHRQTLVDVFAPDGTRLHDGSGGALSFTGKAEADGRFAARVMLATSAAKRGEAATFRISVAVTGAATTGEVATDATAGGEPTAAEAAAEDAAASPDAEKTPEQLAREAVDPARPTTGAERYWAVTGVPSRDHLPVYEEPGVEATIIGTLPPDAAGLKNLGCRMAAGTRWCRVEVGANPKKEGWVAGRYLRAVSSRERDGAATAGARRLRTITGIIACTPAGAEKAGQCETRVQKAAPGYAMVYVTLPDGAVRVLNFRDGNVFVLNPDITMSWKPKGTDYVVTINEVETLVIPKLVIDGGVKRAAEPAPATDQEPETPPVEPTAPG